MQADWSVELGSDDPVLEVPWGAGDGGPRYYDLKRRPELLLEVAETSDNRPLAEFLSTVNTAHAIETAKCDTWVSREITSEEEIFGATEKFGSYIDLLFSEPALRANFEHHERFAREMCRLLGHAPEMSAGIEFVIRRCIYSGAEGYCFTTYVHGYGDEPELSRTRWGIALKVLQHALQQHLASR